MKLLYTYIMVVLSSLALVAQDQQILKVLKDSSQIQLSEVVIDVTIIGNIATTVTKLTFITLQFLFRL